MTVWYVERHGEFTGVITRELPNSWELRQEAAKLRGCTIWIYTGISWFSMSSNKAMSEIWKEGTPPESVLLAHLIGE